MALRSLARPGFMPRRGMSVIATVKSAADTTSKSFPAPAMISAQREVLMEIYKERLYWLNPESIISYSDADFEKADLDYQRYVDAENQNISQAFPEEMRADAKKNLIPTHPHKRMEKINGKTLKFAFPYLFD
ncbi:hypothetical protein NDN08_006779 [Rhodosorus marinus]|uniref:Uncharacterized protein n=1 Tax=Rhodosorus marinus TaxID=101924 RepID=A0AAV8UM68_9RHOD|nr:hypothetical protein NDN08_006779 [Rhodosorus marinus]